MAKPGGKDGSRWRKFVDDLSAENRKAEESGLIKAEGPRRREEPRVPIALRIALQYDSIDEMIENKTLDLSSKGCFIRSRDLKPIGTALTIRLNVGSRAIHLNGVVAHIVPVDDDAMVIPGMGIQFKDLDEGAQAFIDNTLAKFRRSIR